MKLNGKPFNFRPPAKDLVLRFLDNASNEDYFTHDHLARELGIPETTLRKVGKQLGDYTFATQSVRYWGNPKAIAALRKAAA